MEDNCAGEWDLAMSKAYECALRAQEQDEVPVGAVVLKDGQVIASGKNTRETAQDPLGHAEVNALRAAAKVLGSWRLIGCTLVVTLEPCPMCLAACQQARVDRVVYGAKDPKGGALSLGFEVHSDLRLNHRFLADYFEYLPGQEILKQFFKKKRAKI